jgi:hypothetical protein
MMGDFFRRYLPKHFRKEDITIPVVRLHGTIMSATSL